MTTSTSVYVIKTWWLRDGDEECPHCGRMYFYEMEFRCPECDGPGCPHCTAIHTQGHVVCVNCNPVETTTEDEL
jgi:hypothetical protein